LRIDVNARTVTQIGVPSNPGVSFSFVGSDGVGVQTSNTTTAPLGRNKTLVQFDVALTNSLTNVTLVAPTVPAPPAGTTGLLLIPFQATPVTGSGSIEASSDWDGSPFPFFISSSCKGGASDCYRFEEFVSPLAAGATSAAHNVGYEVDKSITTFDVVLLLAADLQNVAAAPAAISLSRTALNFESAFGVMSATTADVVVTNAGGGTITGLTVNVTYGAGQVVGWLSGAAVTLSSTTAPAVLTLAPTAVFLTDDTYNATVEISAPGISNSPQTVAVTLVVTGSPIAPFAIYVSGSDPDAVDDASCGTLSPTLGGIPCRTIMHGIARAGPFASSHVRVADGLYNEAVTLSNGKSLLGGYDPITWQRHVATTNTIIAGASATGNHDRTVIANGITSPTLFEGFVVRGSVNSKTGGNSYALYVSGSPALTISRNAIFGGTGGPGAPGGTGAFGAAGADGTGRSSNPAGYDAKEATGAGVCDASNNRSYSNGAFGSIGGDDVSGGNGGGNTCPPSSTFTQLSAGNGTGGSAGAPALGGSAGTAGTGGVDFRYLLQLGAPVCQIAPSGTHVGGDGGAGGNGQHGNSALGATDADGSVVSGHWMGATGGPGQAGGNGGGGGGGGAGGGAYTVDASLGNHRLGGVGGGGGAGGAGGGGGGSGGAGGGSFGIFIIGAAPVVTNNAIVQGAGGAGGGGGSGSAGSLGGQGGAGGLAAVFCTEAGGRGGNGGQGGTGSGGGGGSGGASFGIYTSGAGTPTYCTSTNVVSGGAGGSGGQGGASQVNPGGPGVSGTLAACSFN
jgi:hypothetical protein